LAEQENASGGMFEFTSTELLENLKERKILDDGMSKMEADDLELKKVYINYYIPSKPKETKEGEKGETIIMKTKAAMLMIVGYKNIEKSNCSIVKAPPHRRSFFNLYFCHQINQG